MSVYDRARASSDDEGGYLGGGHSRLVLSRKSAQYEEVLTCVPLACCLRPR